MVYLTEKEKKCKKLQNIECRNRYNANLCIKLLYGKCNYMISRMAKAPAVADAFVYFQPIGTWKILSDTSMNYD